MKSWIRAGFGQGDITPEGKVSLSGQFCLRHTQEVHSRLKATAIWIEGQNQRTVWVSCDLIEIGNVLQKEVSKRIQKSIPDFLPEQLILSATHVHTAPYFVNSIYGFGSLESFWSDDNSIMTPNQYRIRLLDGIEAAVLEARNNIEECYIETAVSRIKTGYCRRVTYRDGSTVMYGGVTTPDFAGLESRDGGPVNLIYVRRSKDKALTGVIADVPCPAQVLEGKSYVSSDYWGYVREFVKVRLGGDVKVLGLCGAAGDLSPRDLLAAVQGEPDYSEVGGCIALAERISDEIVRLSQKPVVVYGGEIVHKHGYVNLKLPVWNCTSSQYKEALKTIEKLHTKYNLTEDSYKFPEGMNECCEYNCAETCKLRYEGKTDYRECMIHSVRLGNVVLLSNPFELFSEYTDRIRASCSGIQLFDVQLSCDFFGYLPTRRAIRGGGYSACIDNALITADGGDLLVSESIRLIKSLY